MYVRVEDRGVKNSNGSSAVNTRQMRTNKEETVSHFFHILTFPEIPYLVLLIYIKNFLGVPIGTGIRLRGKNKICLHLSVLKSEQIH